MAHDIGLDAHSKTCTAVVIDAAGKIAANKHFPTSEKNLVEFIKTVKRPRELAFEEQNLAHWLFLTASDHVDKLVVAHPAHLPKQRSAKGDFNDAVRLAEELRAGRLTSVFHEDSKVWDLRPRFLPVNKFVGSHGRKRLFPPPFFLRNILDFLPGQ